MKKELKKLLNKDIIVNILKEKQKRKERKIN